MDWQFKIGLGVAVIFGLLPFAVKDMPQSLTWAGIILGGLLAIWGVLPNHEKIPIAPAIIFIACVSGLVGSLIWGWRDLASTEAQPEKIEHSVFLQSAMGMMPAWMPAAGEINVIRLSPSELAKGGKNIVVERRTGQPGSEIKWPQSGRMPGRFGQRCEIINYENAPLMEINIPLKITFRDSRDSIKDHAVSKDQTGSHAGDIIHSGEWTLEITKLDPGVSNSIVIYLINESPYFIDVPLPEVGTTYKWGETGRRTLRVVLPVNFLDRIPMVFQPYEQPVISPPVATPPTPAPPNKPGKK